MHLMTDLETEDVRADRVRHLEAGLDRERRRRRRNEAVLDALTVLQGDRSEPEMLCELMRALEPAFGFDAAAVLSPGSAEGWHPVAALRRCGDAFAPDRRLATADWPASPFLARALTRAPAALIDTDITRTQVLPDLLSPWRSVLGLPLTTGTGIQLGMVCLADRTVAFGRETVATAERFFSGAGGAVEAAVLRRRNAEMREAMDGAMDGLAIVEPDGRFAYMNAAHAALFTASPEHFIGCSWKSLYDPDEAARIEHEAFPALAASGAWRGETLGRRIDGRPIQQQISLSVLSGGRLLCATREIRAGHANPREAEARHTTSAKTSDAAPAAT